MKAIILAAGLGTRLRPITNEIPKCMVSVNGIKIIDKQINNLVSNGIEDILVVAGYKSDVLTSHVNNNFPFVKLLDNTRYAETNNMYSLYLTCDFVKENDFLLMNADVYYDSMIISNLLQNTYNSLIACDRSQYLEESMKITFNNKINHISKNIKKDEYYAVSIDVYKISKEAANILFDDIKNTIEIKKDENSWTEMALDHIFDKTNFQPCVIKDRWVEIDNFEDLAKAEIIFKGDSLCSI
jgi:choline kinase